jgi:glycosyltransferase involved in cell wall biosynthesis
VNVKTISFVIAVYRNQGALKSTHSELGSLFVSGAPLAGYKAEFIYVDDGSDDGSFGELQDLHKADPTVKVISFSRNFGQISAVVAGFRAATGDVIVNKAADQQEPVSAIVAMVQEWESGSEVVLGRRTGREDTFLANVLGDAYWSILRWLNNPNLPAGSDFFLLGRPAADAFNTIDESDRFFPVDVLWLGFEPKVVPYHRNKRRVGRSQWSVSRKVKAGIDGILHSSYLPIRLISMFGFGVAGIGFFSAGLVVIMRLTKGQIYPGWYSIVFLMLVLHGVTLLMLGVVGEYIWRIYNQAKRRPGYVIRRRLGL